MLIYKATLNNKSYIGLTTEKLDSRKYRHYMDSLNCTSRRISYHLENI